MTAVHTTSGFRSIARLEYAFFRVAKVTGRDRNS